MNISKEDMRDIIEGSSQIAQIVTNYFFELKQCGLEDEQALSLAMGYQSTILTMGYNRKPLTKQQKSFIDSQIDPELESFVDNLTIQ